MQIREAAERVLFSTTLDQKLAAAPAAPDDDARGPALQTPAAPGRPEGLRIAPKGTRAETPSLSKIDDERARGVLLHFLANHELLAAELMALNLLKFPDAPAEYRAGVYKAMREEQAHARMYLRRMRECGVEFGSLPLNGYFWRLIAPVESPLDFVARLNLTFEQANLDFARHYAALFRAAGDPATATVLEKIYRDEIGHVGHGVTWLRKWKDGRDSDWQAFAKSLAFPLSPAKAKGLAPFNAEGRRLAGLDEDFIRRLEVCEQSRGRTPVLHWFNPNAEAHARGGEPRLNKFERAMEADLEMVMQALCRRDDILLMRHPPSRQHLADLKAAGFALPEIVELGALGELQNRKLGGLRPWAWSPEASDLLRGAGREVSPTLPWQWREALPSGWLSKEIGGRLEALLGIGSGARAHNNIDSAMRVLGNGEILFKAAHACAGRGHLRATGPCEEVEAWLGETLDEHGCVVSEIWLDRVADFSAQYEIHRDGAEFVGFALVDNDAAGRFRGIRVAPTWSRLLDAEVAEFLFRDAGVTEWYRERIPAALRELLPGYLGPVGVDALVYREGGGALALRHVVEVNVRATMGRVALELMRKDAPAVGGALRVLRKEKWDGAGVALNDPSRAQAFLAVWEAAPA